MRGNSYSIPGAADQYISTATPTWTAALRTMSNSFPAGLSLSKMTRYNRCFSNKRILHAGKGARVGPTLFVPGQDRIMTSNILNGSGAFRAWGSFAGMMTIWPAPTCWVCPEMVMSAVPSAI